MSNSITVVYPHYMATEWMIRSIKSHRALADSKVNFWAIDMSYTEPGFVQMQQKVVTYVDHVIRLPINRKRFYCAEALELALPLAATVPVSEIVVICDTDVLMLRKSWDTQLAQLLSESDVAAINPRSPYNKFIEEPEWNWMAFNRGTIWSFCGDTGLTDHDWGNYVKRRFKPRLKLFPRQSAPIQRCPYAAVCGDSNGPWAFHAFFSTSHLAGDRRDTSMNMTDEEIKSVCDTLIPGVV